MGIKGPCRKESVTSPGLCKFILHKWLAVVKDTLQLSPTKTVKEDNDQEYTVKDQDQLPVN
jgi:hypothetical protein